MGNDQMRLPDYPAVEKIIAQENDYESLSECLWQLTHDYHSCQLIRMKFDNQIRAFEARKTSKRVLSRFIAYRDQMAAIEQLIYAHACEYVIAHPVADWILGIPGMGPIVAMKLLGSIPLRREQDFCTVSKMYKYCGLVPRKDPKERYHGRKIKVVLHNWWRAMLTNEHRIRALDPKYQPERLYVDFYNNWFKIYMERQEYKPKSERWDEIHCKYAAKAKMCTLFISHLWEVWRKALGFSVRKSYAHERLGHITYFPPSDYSSFPYSVKKKMELEKSMKKIFSDSKIRVEVESIGPG